jgi:alpha-glucosidase
VSGRDLEIRDNASANKPIMITPKLDELPVYVHEGTILPIAPVTQSTMEKPDGPLTLRVYPGQECKGTLYEDDGKSFNFRKGEYLRMKFSCFEQPDGRLALHIGAHEGSFKPWWQTIRIEAYGWTPKQRDKWRQEDGRWVTVIPDQLNGTDLIFH